MHTPDSSRYWIADTYAARHAAGQEPENIDKEFLRLWFRQRWVAAGTGAGAAAGGGRVLNQVVQGGRRGNAVAQERTQWPGPWDFVQLRALCGHAERTAPPGCSTSASAYIPSLAR